MNLAFDFGITNTDIVSSDDGTMDYFSFPSESVTDESLKKFLNSLKLDISKINNICLLYTSPSPRDKRQSRMPSSA